MIDKTKAFLRSITFEISPLNEAGYLTVLVLSRIGDGSNAENMGCEYQCLPEQVREVQRIATMAMLDLSEDFVANDTRSVVCMVCGDIKLLPWDSIVTAEDQCEECDEVGTKTTEPRLVTQWRRVPNPKLARPTPEEVKGN